MQLPTLSVAMQSQMILSGSAVVRLLVACALGGVIGIEREWRHKDSGLRTNMLICMGSALFTLMSIILAGESTPNKGQVAANIVQGIGFLGAGLILHARNRVLGMTSAATVFAVAAVGMTCGAGLYGVASIATLLVLLALQLVGALEGGLGWKRYPMIYEVRAEVGAMMPSAIVGEARATSIAEDVSEAESRMQRAILKTLDAQGIRLTVLERDKVADLERIVFSVTATRSKHQEILASLRASDDTDQVVVFRDTEDE